MPKSAKKPCMKSGCTNLVDRGKYCPEHAPAPKKEYDPDYESERGSSSQRGYGARWQRLRKMYLRANPLCVDPFGMHGMQLVPATEVDHITPKARGGSDSWENLQALCKSCHSRKTALIDRNKK